MCKKDPGVHTGVQSVKKAANRKTHENVLMVGGFPFNERFPKWDSAFCIHIFPKVLTTQGVLLTAQLSPLEYLYTLRGRVACLGGFIALCQSVKNFVF